MLDILKQYWDRGLLVLFSAAIAGSLGILLWPAPQYELLVEEGKPLQLLAERPSKPAASLAKASVRSVKVPKAKTPLRPLSVNLNTASGEELEQLPGIGPKLAGRIVAYRKQHGQFNRISDLDNVSGIGPKTLVRLTPFLKI